ncbi:MAG TPA: sigma 54-interacting transcriptional regulator, partial [Pyrinomonadaceae bacterium]|nr:sigma 54-interacting transcriptional regulator [Pyrinomonadaceae bacterium]
MLSYTRTPRGHLGAREAATQSHADCAATRGRDGHARAAEVAPFKPFTTSPLIGGSPSMKRLFTVLARVAPGDSSVFITGATGTGKELVARAIHALSSRRAKVFVPFNCTAVPQELS